MLEDMIPLIKQKRNMLEFHKGGEELGVITQVSMQQAIKEASKQLSLSLSVQMPLPDSFVILDKIVISLLLSVFIHEMGIIRVPSSQGCGGN